MSPDASEDPSLPTGSAPDPSQPTPAVTEDTVKNKLRRRRRKRSHPLEEAAPRYAFDYSGRLWVEKRQRGFFRRLKRPRLPPEE